MGQKEMKKELITMITEDSTISLPEEVEIEDQNLKSLYLLAHKVKVLFEATEISLEYYALDDDAEKDND